MAAIFVGGQLETVSDLIGFLTNCSTICGESIFYFPSTKIQHCSASAAAVLI